MYQSPSEWAQALLTLPNLYYCVIDTTGTDKNADVLRVLIAAKNGEPIYSQIIRPQRTYSPNTAYTGISEHQLDHAPTLAECWDDICFYLREHIILSYGYDFVVSRLAENARAYNLPAPPIVGFCLQRKAETYFNWQGWMKLATACEKVGHYLPGPPMANERAEAVRNLLQAMAQGVTSAPKVDASTDLAELPVDGHPF